MTEVSEPAGVLPGDIVRTPFGPVVVTSFFEVPDGTSGETPTKMIRGRMGRTVGRSLADAPHCILRADSVGHPLPATPGMITMASTSSDAGAPKQKVFVHSYSSDPEMYTVSLKSDPAALLRLPPSALVKCPASKFYPLLEDLLNRADFIGRHASRNLVSALSGKSAVVDDIASEIAVVVQDETGVMASDLTSESAGDFAARVVRATKNNLIPTDGSSVSKGANELISMIKDDEWTNLLEKSKERLGAILSDDLPKACEKTLADAGISISASSSAAAAEKALKAIDGLLQTHAEMDLSTATDAVGNQFHQAMNTMRSVAERDRKMGSIYDLLLERSSAWQNATGDLLGTAGASTFLEGGKRLQARAANMLSPKQMEGYRMGIASLTDSLSGEAAVARLKTLEVGEAVRDRLIAAIEVKTGSAGGLDGMIAKALAGAGGKVSEEEAGSSVKSLVEMLSQGAEKKGAEAQETLLVAVSRRSVYRDEVMRSIEGGLVDLEESWGDTFSMDDIAGIIRGEKGTASLFEPMAKRATAEIEKQLVVAESNVADNPAVLKALGYVRRLVSGELTGDAALKDIVDVLNDESIVKAGEGWLKRGDQVLDVLENAAGNKTVGNVLNVVKDAGGWGDGTLVDAVANLDVNEMIKTAETAYTDAEVRKNLFLSATDSALDFLLRILPSMPVPPLEGVKDGIIYSLSNLGLQGFKVRKENIAVEIAGIKAHKKSPPPASEDNGEDAAADDDSIDSFATAESVKATELLIIDVRDIQANLDDALWSFEQTYFPRMKGSGTASVQLVNAAVRMQFELRRRKVQGVDGEGPKIKKIEDDDVWGDGVTLDDDDDVEDGEEQWEPVLCLCDCSCNIESIDLKLMGTGMAWLINMLAALFRMFLRKYVMFTVEKTLRNSSGYILEMLNDNLCGYWDLIMRTAKLEMDDLAILSEKDIVKAQDVAAEAYEVELVWREAVSLGIQLLMNDESGYMKVVDFPRGGQARNVAEAANLDPEIFKGATITAVNGKRFELPKVPLNPDADANEPPPPPPTTVPQVLAALQVPERPKTISFKLANSEDAERVRCFVNGLEYGEEEEEKAALKEMSVKHVEITDEGPLGLVFASSQDDFGLEVESFSRGDNDETLPVEKNGSVNEGDILVSVNGEIVLGEDGAGRTKFLELFSEVGSKRPLTLGFAAGYLKGVEFNSDDELYGETGPNSEFSFDDKKNGNEGRILLNGFNDVSSALEIGGVLIGDHLVAVNGVPVGAALLSKRTAGIASNQYIDKILERLKDQDEYPMTLTFARPNTGSTPGRYRKDGPTISLQNSKKFNVQVDNYAHMGCKFGPSPSTVYNEVIVASFNAVKGPAHLKMLLLEGTQKGGDRSAFLGMSVEAIDGVSIPSYIDSGVLAGTLKRSWEANGSLNLLFSDDDRKEWLLSLLT